MFPNSFYQVAADDYVERGLRVEPAMTRRMAIAQAKNFAILEQLCSIIIAWIVVFKQHPGYSFVAMLYYKK